MTTAGALACGPEPSVCDQRVVLRRCHEHDFLAVHRELDLLRYVLALADHELGELGLDVALDGAAQC
jgi:hypothetical protein